MSYLTLYSLVVLPFADKQGSETLINGGKRRHTHDEATCRRAATSEIHEQEGTNHEPDPKDPTGINMPSSLVANQQQIKIYLSSRSPPRLELLDSVLPLHSTPGVCFS